MDERQASILPIIEAQDNGSNQNNLFLEEDRDFGNVKKGVVWRFLQSMGGVSTHLIALLFGICNGILENTTAFIFLIYAEQLSFETKREGIWTVLGMCNILSFSGMLQQLIIMIANISASRSFHAKMSFSLLHSKVNEFLERVPLGRLVNLFSEDVEAIDTKMTEYFTTFYLFIGMLIVQLTIIIYTTGSPFLLVPCALLLLIGVWIRSLYMNMKREIIRLKRITKSPITSILSESLTGIIDMRAFGREVYIMKQLDHLINENNKNNLTIFALDSWFSSSMLLASFLLVTVPSFGFVLFSIYENKIMDIKYLVMFITTSTEVGTMLLSILENACGVESLMISVERCLNFEKTPPEEGYQYISKQRKKYTFPKKSAVKEILAEETVGKLFSLGEVSIQGATARYMTENRNVLQNLNIHILPGEKIGIVGRTGAGKTSFIKLFWRALELSEGTINIDGVDISKLGLKEMRREITIVSQEAALFSGTLRENIDPKLQYSISRTSPEFKVQEDTILQHLKDLGFSPSKLQKKGLDLAVVGNGENLSMGERQIIAFTRTLISTTRLILLDEATASIDLKTEEQIQKMIFENFKDRTMMIIAHRIQTVIKCDKILVLGNGQVLEFDTVSNLLAKEEGAFKEIYRQFNK